MLAAFCLTVGAMVVGTWMALAMSVSFDALIFIPIAYIAYFKRGE